MNETPAQGTTPLLEPCPFCGGAAVIKCITDTYRPDTYDWWVSCVVCTVERPSTKLSERAHRRDEAIGAWNQRAPDAERQRLIAELAESQAYALQLERALGEAWEPVPSEYEIVEENGDCLNIEDGTISTSRPDTDAERYARFWFTLPDNIRLCRRTSSSPTAEGE